MFCITHIDLLVPVRIAAKLPAIHIHLHIERINAKHCSVNCGLIIQFKHIVQHDLTH